MSDDTRAPITNEQIAQDLEISHSMVSRIRSGSRRPSLALMIKISAVYMWKVEAQTHDYERHQYAAGFERALQYYLNRMEQMRATPTP